ncbi:stimulator of interferon genes protein-like isoform X2 [Ornithodoros turicata]|uniref:stimulator of interferon genes protein-like isoform X2 n=1 Tax=Ornithodoros turicata TaxID=34597 RepID=UPI003138D277
MSSRSDPGVGLAYTAFFTYYRTVALSLLQRIKAYEEYNGIRIPVKKVFVLMPTSCCVAPELGDGKDDGIEVANSMEEVRAPRAGTRHRTFKNTVYLIKNGDDPLYCVAEGPTPLLTLYDMKERNVLTESEMVEQMHIFCRKLERLLDSEDSCVGLFRLIIYEDRGNEKVAKVSEILREEILKEMGFTVPSCLLHAACLSTYVPGEEARLRTTANVGSDLAVAYYSGYLKLLENAPQTSSVHDHSSLLDRIKEYEKDNKVNVAVKKLFILMPESCSIGPVLGNDDDDGIEVANAMKELRVSRAGTKHRKYSNTVYIITNGDDDLFYCVAEGATPLLTLFDMKEQNILTEEEMTEQMGIFKHTLEKLLSTDCKCGELFKLITYEDAWSA